MSQLLNGVFKEVTHQDWHRKDITSIKSLFLMSQLQSSITIFDYRDTSRLEGCLFNVLVHHCSCIAKCPHQSTVFSSKLPTKIGIEKTQPASNFFFWNVPSTICCHLGLMEHARRVHVQCHSPSLFLCSQMSQPLNCILWKVTKFSCPIAQLHSPHSSSPRGHQLDTLVQRSDLQSVDWKTAWLQWRQGHKEENCPELCNHSDWFLLRFVVSLRFGTREIWTVVGAITNTVPTSWKMWHTERSLVCTHSKKQSLMTSVGCFTHR